jgi:hypothetical protein
MVITHRQLWQMSIAEDLAGDPAENVRDVDILSQEVQRDRKENTISISTHSLRPNMLP